ncbi:MAG: gliding motility protein GldC [Chitinophagaceae bacterium]|nr:MAG: gliding motility protein GldC [Chitinophagaceae bacterium]
MQKDKKSEIIFKVELDDKNIPEKISWNTFPDEQNEFKDTKSVMLSIWDAKENNTLRLDLWTKEMRVDEMRTHFLQTLVTSAESFHKATGNPYVMADMKEFCEKLAQKTNEWEKNQM